MTYTIIDAHSHLWLRQDTSWNGMPIRTLKDGRSFFLTEEVQMLPPFMIDGRNTAEVFLSNMNYAQVGGAVVVQEFIDGLQNDYLEQVGRERILTVFSYSGCAIISTTDSSTRLRRWLVAGLRDWPCQATGLSCQTAVSPLTLMR